MTTRSDLQAWHETRSMRSMHKATAMVEPATRSRGSVLLIDDEAPLLRVYGRILRTAGFSVVELSEGRSVAGALASTHFDVVVSDIGMPGVNGINVLQTVHGIEADLPVVLMTGGADLSTAMKAVEHGALRYLMKPIDPTLLSQLVGDAVRFRQMAKVKRRAFELYGRAASEETDRAELAVRFKRALETLHVAYQPIVRCADRTTFAHEALVRTEETSLRRPDDLFAAAETLGRLKELGRTIRWNVAKMVSTSSSQTPVFVNLHPNDLEDEELMSPTAPLSLVASRIVLEVTERAPIETVGQVQSRLTTLRRYGYRVAIDDLGAGYAGLTAFAQLRPEVVKFDMSLIRGIDQDITKQKLIHTMTDLCADLGMQVIGEGVETAAERDTLLKLGCQLFQGYLFARPGPAFPRVVWGAI